MRFYGQIFGGVPQDQFLYQKWFSEYREGFFIECGAADGINLSSCKFFEEFMGWTGVNIEASPKKWVKLVENRPKSLFNLNLGLLDREDILVFKDDDLDGPNRGAGWGNGSFYHQKSHLMNLQDSGVKFKEYQVKVTTWKKLIEYLGIKKVDLFVLDVEGVEDKVLEGMIGSQVLPQHIFIEHEHIGFSQCQDIMDRLGYRLDWNDWCNSMYILRGV